MTGLGIHIIADLEGCNLDELAVTEAAIPELKGFVSNLIARAGLQELGNFYHYFGPGAVTAIVCLAESHLSFHTWPELQRVNFDIFVCNRSVDHSAQAREILEACCAELFRPLVVRKNELCRHG